MVFFRFLFLAICILTLSTLAAGCDDDDDDSGDDDTNDDDDDDDDDTAATIGRWSVMENPNTENLSGVYGFGLESAFAVGKEGTVLSYDGTSWKSLASDTQTWLLDVWGSGPSDLFITGVDNTILHYDGVEFEKMDLSFIQTEINLPGIWGTAGDDVYATGDGGTILHYDGSFWRKVPIVTDGDLNSIWGATSDLIFAVGQDRILQYSGVSWREMDILLWPQDALRGVWGTSGENVYAVGEDQLGGIGLIFHYAGDWWSLMETSRHWISGISGFSTTEAYAVGQNGTLMAYNGLGWTIQDSGTEESLTDIWCSGNAGFIVGTGGAILKYTEVPGS